MHQLTTRLLHSRYAAVIAFAIMALSAVFALDRGVEMVQSENSGVAFVEPGAWIPSAWLSMCVCLGAIALSAIMMVNMLRVYNFLRAMSVLPVTLMMVMLTSLPSLTTRLNSGVVLLTVTMACTMLLFSCYGDKYSMHRVFLIFVILSAMIATQYAYAVLVPVFFLGCVQMRIVTLRTVCAMGMGLVTPWWILLGFGIVDIDSLHLPHVHNIFRVIGVDTMAVLLVYVAVTAFLGIASWVMTLMRTITYNASSRAYNGFFAILMLSCVIAMCADYTNITTYIPLLACCSSVHTAHIFCIHRREKSYLGILAVVLTYYLIYFWRILI